MQQNKLLNLPHSHVLSLLLLRPRELRFGKLRQIVVVRNPRGLFGRVLAAQRRIPVRVATEAVDQRLVVPAAFAEHPGLAGHPGLAVDVIAEGHVHFVVGQFLAVLPGGCQEGELG